MVSTAQRANRFNRTFGTFRDVPGIPRLDGTEGHLSPTEALAKFGLDWEVEKLPFTVFPNPDRAVTSKKFRAIVRKDNDDIFGTCTDGYTFFQNRDLANLAEAIGRNGGAQTEALYVAREGREVGILLKAGTWSLGDDVTETYAFLRNGHDGGLGLQLSGFDFRVRCANAFSRGRKIFSVSHTKSIHEKVVTILAQLLKIQHDSQEFQVIANKLAGRTVSATQPVIRELFGVCHPTQHAHLASKDESAADRAKKQLDKFSSEIWALIDSDTNKTDATRGTAYGLWNATTEYVDHRMTVAGEASDPTLRTRRALVDPRANEAKRKALELVASL
jgi:phage/plasmid-like protein (TIGR03299 family)